MIYVDYIKTPLGLIKIQASEQGLTHSQFIEARDVDPVTNSVTDLAGQQLNDYFENRRQQFDVPLDLQGTEFQKAVWSELIKIPFGQSLSYSELAKKINKPKAMRAVGTANGRNPVAIIVPCHRVIGRDKRLSGYAWGLDCKSWLLRHEAIDFIE